MCYKHIVYLSYNQWGEMLTMTLGQRLLWPVIGSVFGVCSFILVLLFRLITGYGWPRCVVISPRTRGTFLLPLLRLRLYFVVIFKALDSHIHFLFPQFPFSLFPLFLSCQLIFQCIWVADVHVLWLSYPVRRHGIALPVPLTALWCSALYRSLVLTKLVTL